MKQIDLHHLDYSIYAALAGAMVLVTAFLTSPDLGRVARTLVSGAWLYLFTTRG